MGTFLFTNILLLKEKKHGRAKSCSPMPKGSRHSSQRVPTLSGKYVSFSSTLHSCLPPLPTAPFFFIFSLIQSSHPRKGGLTLAWRALSVFHTTLVSPLHQRLFNCYPSHQDTDPYQVGRTQPSGCMRRYLSQHLITKNNCSTFLGIRHLSPTGKVLSAFPTFSQPAIAD